MTMPITKCLVQLLQFLTSGLPLLRLLGAAGDGPAVEHCKIQSETSSSDGVPHRGQEDGIGIEHPQPMINTPLSAGKRRATLVVARSSAARPPVRSSSSMTDLSAATFGLDLSSMEIQGALRAGTNALSFSASARHVYDYLAANASTVQYEYRTSNRRAPYEYCSRILLRTGFRTKRGVTSSISPVTSSFSSYCFGMYSCNYELYLHISTTRLRVGD